MALRVMNWFHHARKRPRTFFSRFVLLHTVVPMTKVFPT